MKHVRALEWTRCGETAEPDRLRDTCANHPVVGGILEVTDDYDVIDERSIADADERRSDGRADETDSSPGGLDVSDRGWVAVPVGKLRVPRVERVCGRTAY
ncbi:threonine synthase 2 [Natronococcus amylolyticus DSM 10524]|uniref:Threonine synthase 2 n=1 Tax=Natronococcus amylolyticus DSM 10524 TaxID=1227497 RepID=L9X318_9EURY|nr:hypothetical protein [Natronococcus amylolyticus]ELY54978.1 threonine synthase 2 [Natronococcus amylolyticus DSM 10524]